MEIGIFSRTYGEPSYEDVLKRMTSDGIFHTQLNLVSTGLPSLPEEADEEQILRIRELCLLHLVNVSALLFQALRDLLLVLMRLRRDLRRPGNVYDPDAV